MDKGYKKVYFLKVMIELGGKTLTCTQIKTYQYFFRTQSNKQTQLFKIFKIFTHAQEKFYFNYLNTIT